MRLHALIAAILMVLTAPLILSAPAAAQATRTWVSGVGDDVNPCSRTAPCKTFAGAISKTAAAGEINCIDPGGFGSLTITKSISIICDDVEAGILASGTNGININAGVNDTILLSGLDFEGGGTGLKGLNILQAGAVHIRNSIIRGFNVSPGTGIHFNASNTSELTVDNVTIDSNSGVGIAVVPTGSAAALVAITNSTITNNANCIASNAGTGLLTMTIDHTTCSGNTVGGVNIADTAGAASDINVYDSVLTNNGTGIGVAGNLVTLRVGGSVIKGNTTATAVSLGATLQSYGNNQIDGNTNAGPAIPTIGSK